MDPYAALIGMNISAGGRQTRTPGRGKYRVSLGEVCRAAEGDVLRQLQTSICRRVCVMKPSLFSKITDGCSLWEPRSLRGWELLAAEALSQHCSVVRKDEGDADANSSLPRPCPALCCLRLGPCSGHRVPYCLSL